MARGRPVGSKNKLKLAVVDSSGGFHPAELREAVAEIEASYEEIASAKADYMNTCKGIRGQIADLFSDAAVHGIPRAELKAIIKTRALERKAEGIRANLTGTSEELYDQMIAALGDLATTPLGMAAISHHPQPAA